MTRRYFGTDGVRGAAGEDLTAELALRLGRAAGSLAGAGARALIVRDTRESGPMLESALASGFASAGVDVQLGGVAPTPAAAIAVRREGFDLAAVISASRNPYGDNGIKFLGGDGHKLTDAQEAEIEARLHAPAPPGRFGAVIARGDTARRYRWALAERFEDLDLRGLSVVLDCANGAAAAVAPDAFVALGARVVALGLDPDGRNINAGCGSSHPEALIEAVVAGGHDIGFAFDGDADRVLACDRNGRLLDGDDLVDRNFAPSGDGIAAALLCVEALAGRDGADAVAACR